MLKSILEICVLLTAAVLVSCVCSALLWQSVDLRVFCLLLVQYLFVSICSLQVFVYLNAVAARALRPDGSEIRAYTAWAFGCLLVMCIQISTLAVAKL
jgi:hypothetical protein